MSKFLNNSNKVRFINKLETEIGNLDKNLYYKPNFNNPIECEQRAQMTRMKVALDNINKGNFDGAEMLLEQFDFHVD